MSVLLKTIGDRGYTTEEERRMVDALDALSENPLAVSVNRKLLEQIWPESERHLGVERSGFLLVIINSTVWKRRGQIKRALENAGVLRKRIKFVKGDGPISQVEGDLDSQDCRAVLFMKDIPKKVKDLIVDDTAQMLKGFEEKFVNYAVILLRRKLL